MLPLRPRLFVVLYLLSGAAALLYEVAWLRLLTMSMGHTTGAVGAVLAAFMGGLAIGAWLAGRITPSLDPGRAMRIYAALEATIALCALALPFALDAMHPLLAWAYADGTGGALFAAVRLGISVALIALPAAAMGASFPVGVVAVRDSGSGIRDPKDSGSQDAGELYAANTVGAAIGAALTGFILLPALGLFGTTLVGVALNAIAAAGAFVLSTRTVAPSHASHVSHPHPSHLSHPSHFSHVTSASIALAVSGFVALVYEVTWTRVLAMTLGPTTYAFSAMLVAFIAGLAIGSAIATALVPRVERPGIWLGGSMILSALAALLASTRVDQLPLLMAAAAGHADASFTSVFALEVGLAIAMQLPMTIALGAAFPFAVTMASGGGSAVAERAATVYAANTAGAIAGALTGSFVMVPRLGLQPSLETASVLAVCAGLAVAWRPAANRVLLAIAAAGVMVIALVSPEWNHARLAAGGYRIAPMLAAGDIENALEAGEFTYYREGAAGTVSVRRLIGVTSLAIDGKVDASNGADMLTQKLLAHLPLLLHEDPRNVYIIGLGSGVTLGAALSHPIEHAVVSEISPEVVAASRSFVTENHDALADPRARLIVGDGRSHLLLSSDQYDVIISEPSNPWMAGVSTLFTREFFAAAKKHLRPGGILCQWAHTYNISEADLGSIVATFLEAFPSGSAWLVGESDLLLIGSESPLTSLDEGIGRAWSRAGVAADLREVDIHDPFAVLTLFVARAGDLRQYSSNAAVQTDDRLALEYSAPRATYGRYRDANAGSLHEIAARAQQPPAVSAARSMATAAHWRDRAAMNMRADAPEAAYQDLVQALKQAPDDVEALAAYTGAAAASGHLDAAEAYLRNRAASADSSAIQVELSRVLATRADPKGAVMAAQRAALLDPSNERALGQLVSTLADDRNEAGLTQLGALLQQSKPDRPVTLYCGMRLASLRGDFAQAVSFGERLVASGGDKENAARDLNLLGIAYESSGNADGARRAFESSLKVAPRAAATMLNVGYNELKAGRPAAAERRFSEALFVYPRLAPALNGLAQALEQQGDAGRAARIRALTTND